MRASPWSAIPSTPPFVLADDQGAIDRFNARCSETDRIELAALPEPFIGPTDADLVLLNLNPGWDDADPAVHSRPAVSELLRTSLAGGASAFYYFDKALSDTPGAKWWQKRLAPLVRAVGSQLATRLMVIEWFPYHSRKFNGNVPRLESQEFSFDLARAAIARGAWILSMRAERRWVEAVPALVGYARYAKLKNRQNVTVSPGNCARFDELVHALD